MSRRWMTVHAGLLAAIAAAAWLHAEATPARSDFELPQLGRYYAVDLSGAHPAIDLEFDGDSRYEFIVTSLGDGLQTYPVRLEAHAQRRAELFPAVPVKPLNPQPARASSGDQGRVAGAGPTGSPGEWPTRVTSTSRFTTSAPALASVPSAFTLRGFAALQPRPPSLEMCTPATERRFFLHVTADRLEDEQGYVPVTGVLAGEGDLVRVYLDRETSAATVAPGLIDEIVRLLDREIIPRSRAIVGEHADIDGDGKLTVLVTGWLSRLCGGTTSLNGFVRSSDFQEGVDPPFGNHADVIYVNADLAPGAALKTLLAHEYTHAVCFSRRLAAGDGRLSLPAEEDWLNEAIAHVAERLHGGDWSNLKQRIAAFLAAPHQSPLIVADYYRAGLWRDSGCRGATFLFLQFCVDRFGERLVSDLVSGPSAGKSNLERATATRFAELLRHWAIALSEGDQLPLPDSGSQGASARSRPARIRWTANCDPCRLELRGTAAAFIDVSSTARPGVVRIALEAAPGARLQLTLVRRAR
jgi:hypothetical protein